MTTPNNIIFGTDSKNALFGTSEDDTIDGLKGDDWIRGMDGNDLIIGGEGDDALSGGHGDDTLQGGTGNDSLDGGYGQDLLEGGTGDDTLVGGHGIDTLIGGAGADRFTVGEFKVSSDQLIGSPVPASETGPDIIGDFNHLEGDMIDLSIVAEQALHKGLIGTAGELAQYVSFVPSESLSQYDPAYQFGTGSTGLVVDLSSLDGTTEVVAVLSDTNATQLAGLASTILQYVASVI
jgi:Ca2+-binding RTX toxin-like protein